MSEAEDKTLSRHQLKHFILKLDFLNIEANDIAFLVSKISPYFDRVEKKIETKYDIRINVPKSEISQKDGFTYICASNDKTLSFSENNKSITFESSKYKNYRTYLDIFEPLIEAMGGGCNHLEIKRIGMRFINEFPCQKISNIKNIFVERLAKPVALMLKSSSASRVIAMEEHNHEQYKLRAQYGVANQYYPEPIKIYDLLLDVDVFIDGVTKYDKINESTKLLNHAAYHYFTSSLKEDYISKLK